ncbi:hypothetical protein ACHAXA_010056 [Cyclostephanos tholiformis]|uniref:Uncharacterized protein n=1 Tax=Cyclostephanos tholiformis TaxID=382380 RepID=A0ABD3SF55_9STRA
MVMRRRSRRRIIRKSVVLGRVEHRHDGVSTAPVVGLMGLPSHHQARDVTQEEPMVVVLAWNCSVVGAMCVSILIDRTFCTQTAQLFMTAATNPTTSGRNSEALHITRPPTTARAIA